MKRTYIHRKEFTPKQRAEIMARDEGRCQCCGEPVGSGRPYAYDHLNYRKQQFGKRGFAAH